MKPIFLIVEHRNSKAFESLKAQNDALTLQVSQLHRALREVELKYGAEVKYNNALCDILRAHGIPFRHVFEHDYRYRKP